MNGKVLPHLRCPWPYWIIDSLICSIGSARLPSPAGQITAAPAIFRLGLDRTLRGLPEQCQCHAKKPGAKEKQRSWLRRLCQGDYS